MRRFTHSVLSVDRGNKAFPKWSLSAQIILIVPSTSWNQQARYSNPSVSRGDFGFGSRKCFEHNSGAAWLLPLCERAVCSTTIGRRGDHLHHLVIHGRCDATTTGGGKSATTLVCEGAENYD